jgi:23S rRNA (guanosine2251-2'-O)-methyltransferase
MKDNRKNTGGSRGSGGKGPQKGGPRGASPRSRNEKAAHPGGKPSRPGGKTYAKAPGARRADAPSRDREDPGYNPYHDKKARKSGALATPRADRAGPRGEKRDNPRGEKRDNPRGEKRDNPRGESRDNKRQAETRRPVAPKRAQSRLYQDDRPARPQHDRAERPARIERTERVKKTHIAGPRPNLFGMHAVREAWLNPKRSIHALYLTEEAAKIFESWPSPKVARPMPVPVQKDDLDRMLNRKEDGHAVHQGFALSAAPLEEVFVQDLLSIGTAQERSVILMLDQVTDPHNVGAILRSASAFGAAGVVMQKRHAPELEGVLCKTASGAVDHLPVAYETNLSRALEELKEAGYVVIGLDEHAAQSLGTITPPAHTVFVLGNEGDGMRRLIRDHCDHLVTLPTQKPINSLNVSNAAAVALYALLST